jgi:hypothetical protein
MATIGVVAPFVGNSYFAIPDVLSLKPEITLLILLTLGIYTVVLVDSEIALKLSGIKDNRPNARSLLCVILIYFALLSSIP